MKSLNMKSFKINTKLCYLISCIMLLPFLFGCKALKENITVIYGLPESSYVSEVKSSLENKKPIVVAFTAEWCPHCKQYKPVFFEVKNLFLDNVTFINVDVDSPEGSPISERFQVSGIPTTAFIREDGSVFKVQVGEIGKEDLTNLANDLIKSKKKKRGEPIAPFPIELKKVQPAQTEKAPPPQELIDNKEKEQVEKEPIVVPPPEETSKEEPSESIKEQKEPEEGTNETTSPEEPQDDTSDQELEDTEN